jgi:hypothetical protein
MTKLPLDPVAERCLAAQELGLPSSAGSAEARGAFLRLLPAADFVPPPDWLCAYEALAEQRLPGMENGSEARALLTEEECLRDDVEAFAAEFFSLGVSERQSRWQELDGPCAAFAGLAARLRDLKPGLAIDQWPEEGADFLVIRLAAHIRDLFPQRPLPRALKRQAVIADMKHEMATWQPAARRLSNRFPAIAGLEPELIRRLSAGPAQRKQRAPVPAPAPPPPIPTSYDTKGSGKGAGAAVGILISIVIAVVQIANSQRNRTPPPTFPRFNFQPPKVVMPVVPNPPDFQDIWKQQQERMQKDLQNRWPPPGGQPPWLDPLGNNRNNLGGVPPRPIVPQPGPDLFDNSRNNLGGIPQQPIVPAPKDIRGFP